MTISKNSLLKNIPNTYPSSTHSKEYVSIVLDAFHSKLAMFINRFSMQSILDMADMARLIVTYHYGGVYMDLDFHCHRPLFCLEQFVLDTIRTSNDGANSQFPVDFHNTPLLIVSREPYLHAKYIHHTNRIVIQDFFLASAKHPFIKWFLDSRLEAYLQNPNLASKGPFSYHIQEALDQYYKLVNSSYLLFSNMSSIAYSSAGGYIYELPAEILHPLIDSSNSRLATGCRSDDNKDPMLAEACKKLERGQVLQAAEETMMVHMWTHTYLGK
jgi:hypothetical protein